MKWLGSMTERRAFHMKAGTGYQFIVQLGHGRLAQLPWIVMYDSSPDPPT